MASSLAEDLVCPICLGLFQEPHMLGCGHNFCLACLQSAVPGGRAAGTCPECRGPFQLAELKRNRVLSNLAQKVRRWEADEEPLPGASAGPLHFCEEHDEPLKLFCTEDEEPVCVICRDLPQHRGHEFLPTKEAAKFAQGKLKTYLKPLKTLLKEKAKHEADQQKGSEAMKNYCEDLVDYISKGFEALHQTLHSKEQVVKLVIENIREKTMEEMENSLSSLKKEMSSHTETIAKVKAALEATDHILFLKGFKKLLEQVKEDNQEEIYCDEEEETSNEDVEDTSDCEDEDEDTSDREDEDEDTSDHEDEDEDTSDHEDEDEDTSDREDEDEDTSDREDEDEDTSDHEDEDEDTSDCEDEDEDTSDREDEDEDTSDREDEDEDTSDHEDEDEDTSDCEDEDEDTSDREDEDEDTSDHEDEDEDTSDHEEEDEEETDDADSNNAEVINLERVKNLFKFETWKEMLECIIPGEETGN